MEVDISYELDFSPTTCTYDEGMAHYKHRTQVLTAISERIEKCTPPPMKLPDVKKICGGNFEAKAAARVPGAFQCAFLLEHIDTIADTMQWTVSIDSAFAM